MEEIPLEIFAVDKPPDTQHGYRHMVIEERLLTIGGEKLRDPVLTLKRNGIKTEPAFSRVLDLKGDPYVALLQLEQKTDQELAQLISEKL